MKVSHLYLSDFASVDSNGKLNINSIFDSLKVKSFPTTLVRAFVTFRPHGTANQNYHFKLQIKLENKVLEDCVFTLDSTTGDNGQANVLVELVGIPIKELGDYDFCIYEGQTLLDKTTVKISKDEPKPTRITN